MNRSWFMAFCAKLRYYQMCIVSYMKRGRQMGRNIIGLYTRVHHSFLPACRYFCCILRGDLSMEYVAFDYNEPTNQCWKAICQGCFFFAMFESVLQQYLCLHIGCQSIENIETLRAIVYNKNGHTFTKYNRFTDWEV